MKELTIEQKAKAYDEAIKRGLDYIRHTPATEMVTRQDIFEAIFPEFKESEDERIRKDLIQWINEFPDTIWRGHYKKDVVTWLEKQDGIAKLNEEEQNKFAKGVLTSCTLSFINYLDAHKYEGKMCVSNGECEDIENAFHNAMWDRLHRYYCKYIEKQGDQRPINDIDEDIVEAVKDTSILDMVEPKFEVGDWIIRSAEGFKHNTYLIKEIKDYYVCEDLKGRRATFTFSDVHKNFKLWNISDAKRGDVLAFKDGTSGILLYKESTENFGVVSYCSIIGNSFINKVESGWGSTLLSPATKEQHDTLEKAITDAGYKWDNEKGMKQIEQKLTDKVEPKFHEGDWITNGSCIIQITSVDDIYYWQDNNTVGGDIESTDKEYHLWTIQDAKEGDILTTPDGYPFIFKGFAKFHPDCPSAYCGIDEEKYFTVCSGDGWWTDEKVYPATKEQCDLLFLEMKEAEYEWDAEKKELKKIEHNTQNLWYPANGDYLPEIDREVIALLDNGKVVFAHRPQESWKGENISTGKVETFYPKRYGKGGWNQPDVKWWLDYNLPQYY